MPTEPSLKKKFSAKILRISDLSGDVKEFTLKIDEPFVFNPGQYVWVELPALITPDPHGERRAFSICNLSDSQNTIKIIARLSPSGFKQTLFGLKEGGAVNIHGPFGPLKFPEDTGIPVICVAGGVGIAPFAGLIPDSALDSPKRKIVLITVNRNGEKPLYADFFKQIRDKTPDFQITEVSGKIGQDTLLQMNKDFPQAQWIVIGPKSMVHSVASVLFAAGLPQDRITFEEFYLSKNYKSVLPPAIETTDMHSVFVLAAQQSNNHLIITDANGIIIFANQAAENITGYKHSEMIGETPRLWGAVESPDFYKKFWQTIKTEKKPFVGEIRNRRKNGEAYLAHASISPITDKDGDLLGFVGTERDITREKLVDKMKTEFVSLASHQLRTPLTAIKWSLEILLQESESLNERQKSLLSDLENSNERMIELVNSLLNISRIESGRITVNPVPTNIVKLANDVVGKLKMEIAKKDISLVINVTDNLPEINVDPSLIYNIYQNLLTNAIAYSPAGSKITLSISLKDGAIISCVSDSGIGIPEADKPHIFEKFYRASNAKQVRPDGSGLGLYIIKSLLESSGGKIWYESVPEHGSAFYFSIPLTGMAPKEGQVSLA